jgi:hypothetical protein
MIQAPPRKAKKRREKRTDRDTLAYIFMSAWVLVLMQGALRKWVFPGINAIYLIQDIPLLLAYIFAFWKGLVWQGRLAWMCVAIAILLSIETMVQMIFVDLSLRTAIVGLHHYIFYLPILFIAPVSFNAKHRLQFIRWNLLFIIPMALLAALQSRAPKGAWINKTSAGDETGFGLATDTVRATGTFNFTLTYSIWCGFAVGLVLGEWLMPPERRAFKSQIMLLLCTMSGILATMVSGSRTAVMLAGLAFVGGFASVVVTRNAKLIVRFGAVLIVLPFLALAAYIVVPKSFNALTDRFGEDYHEDLYRRINNMTIGFMSVPQFSILGKGIGFGIPAANPGAGANTMLLLSEHESIRTVQELGSFVGPALVIFRYCIGIALLFAGYKALMLRRSHSLPHAMPLAFASMPTLAISELVRSAPVISTQIFFAIALILGALLFREEPLSPGIVPLSKTR